MTNPSVALTRRRYGNRHLVILPNPFDSRPVAAAIAVIGEQRHNALKTKAEERNWTPIRLEAEIRCLADEVKSSELS